MRPGDEENDEFPAHVNEGSLQSVSTDVDLALEATEYGICFLLSSLKEFWAYEAENFEINVILKLCCPMCDVFSSGDFFLWGGGSKCRQSSVHGLPI